MYSIETRYKKGEYYGPTWVYGTMINAMKDCKKKNDLKNGWQHRVIHYYINP